MISEQYLNNRTLNLRVEGLCIILTEEAPPWLAPTSQENFEKIRPLEWLKTHSFCVLCRKFTLQKSGPRLPLPYGAGP